MFLQHVHVDVLDGQEAAFEVALCEVRRRVFMSPGFRGLAVAQGAELPSSYLVQVRWETAEELADVVDSGRFERCWAPVEPLLARPRVVTYFLERPGLAAQGPGATVDLDLAWLSG